jgi:glutamate dehydrogenase
MDTGEAQFLAAIEPFLEQAIKGPYPAFRDGNKLALDAEAFLRGFHEDASPDELAGLSTVDLLTLAHDFWTWRRSLGDKPRGIRLRSAEGDEGRSLRRDVIEIVGPDMPFLVDSALGELADQGVQPLALFHPIAPAAVGKISMIQLHAAPMAKDIADATLAGLTATIQDVHAAVADFQILKRRMNDCADELGRSKAGVDRAEISEAIALLRWLAADRFTFLGARDYEYARDENGGFAADEPIILQETGLGLLRDPERYVLRRSAEPLMLTAEIQRLLQDKTPLVVAKSTLRSRVHRRASADYIGVKRYDAEGNVVGETRFIGLFTSDAYNEMTRDIPVLRRKVEWVLENAGFTPGSHNQKTLANILETYPRDELWQIEQGELERISRGILHLIDRPRPRVFVRRDRFNRFVSVLAFLPKDRFNSVLREAVGRKLEDSFGGHVESFYPQLGEGPLARVHYLVADIDRARPDPDPIALEHAISALTRTWDDSFEDAVAASNQVSDPDRDALNRRARGAFSAGYRERFDVNEALIDLIQLSVARADETVRVRAYRWQTDAPNILRCKIYVRDALLPLSATLPILENMGLFVESELNFPVKLAAFGDRPAQSVFIHDIELRSKDGQAIAFDVVERSFEEAFAAIWTGVTENDGFNRLILALGIGWREAALLRALARYRQQTGLDPSQVVQEAALADHPEISAKILALFRVRFDPSLPEPVADRQAWADRIEKEIEAALNEVASLDADRVLRRIARLVKAIVRTNYYQHTVEGGVKRYMSFKIASQTLEDLPLPKPYREIWVAGPEVEGVHLRFGAVARGGLRWSDRRDDFRTEVLDLVKAQQVKNAIIVPVGAKGGFFPKLLPARSAPNFAEVGQAAYKTFLRGLLDITDNITAQGLKAPPEVVRWDGDDPYLVVAADKGTATFSDIANGISAEYGHWLGDAFASGGSVGYDHKAMGITAKGAWEAVKRHFREIGKDIQTEPFTVVGVGDMSGDVFGNGMLLSRQIQLVAAFDHRDIFIDPQPDIEASFKERERMFALPRSSWQDYNKDLISKGGGVFSRALKAIPLTAEMAALTGLSGQTATPSELMNALLKAQVELLWFGGIGTFVKAGAESHAQVGDKTNDPHRVDAEDLRALVIGEGANLGVTQAGRVAFAKKGGRINTDAVDNSAGVDTSDHEVNIKILLADVIGSGALPASERDGLLASMTDEVSILVLAHNYHQTLALTLAQDRAGPDIDSHERFIERLEKIGKLSRVVEGLPSAEDLRARRESGQGLTRPELAKLIAYAKIDLFDSLVASLTPDDPHFEQTLISYFPTPLGKFDLQMKRHRLRREIIATRHADALINMGGPTFIDRVRDTVRAEPVTVAAAFEAARHIYEFDAMAARINALDNLVPAKTQSTLHQEITFSLRRLVSYLVRRGDIGTGPGQRGIAEVIGAYRPVVSLQRSAAATTLTATELQRCQDRQAIYERAGAPADLARDISLLPVMVAALDVADLAGRKNWDPKAAACLYRAVGAGLGLDRIRAAAAEMSLAQHWDRLAVRRAVEEIYEDQRALAEAAMNSVASVPLSPDRTWAEQVSAEWVAQLGQVAVQARAAIAELEASGPWTFAKLMIAAAELNGLAKTVSRG